MYVSGQGYTDGLVMVIYGQTELPNGKIIQRVGASRIYIPYLMKERGQSKTVSLLAIDRII
jgi:hypothetical protein